VYRACIAGPAICIVRIVASRKPAKATCVPAESWPDDAGGKLGCGGLRHYAV